MARLGHQELRALSEALLDVYSPGPHADLAVRMFTTLHRCLSFDFLGYHEISNNQNHRSVIYPEYHFDDRIFEAYLHQHPTWNGVVRDRLESSVKISDFVSRDEWQRTDLYNYIFRPQGQNHQLGFITFGEFPQLGVALNRSTCDFSEEERSLLDLLKPHLSQALTASKLFSYYSDAAKGNGRAWIVANNAGRILFETGKAIDLLKEYFGHNGSLPVQVRDWLKRRASTLDRHLKRLQTEGARSIGPAYQVKPPNLQHFIISDNAKIPEFTVVVILKNKIGRQLHRDPPWTAALFAS